MMAYRACCRALKTKVHACKIIDAHIHVYEHDLSFVYIFSFNIDWLIFLQIHRWDLFVCRNNLIEQVHVIYEQSQPHLSWTSKHLCIVIPVNVAAWFSTGIRKCFSGMTRRIWCQEYKNGQKHILVARFSQNRKNCKQCKVNNMIFR